VETAADAHDLGLYQPRDQRLRALASDGQLRDRMDVIYVLPDYYRYPKPCMGAGPPDS
jgi:hypothetical protein